MGLHTDLAAFDGKSVAPLEDIHARYEATPELLDALIELIGAGDKNAQTGASWLLRAYLMDGVPLRAGRVARLGELLPELPDGFGRLHICQAMDHLEIPEPSAEGFAAFFRSCEGTANTFLRAWAAHGFFRLGLQHPSYEDEARQWVERALADPAPSVRARARKTLAGE